MGIVNLMDRLRVLQGFGYIEIATSSVDTGWELDKITNTGADITWSVNGLQKQTLPANISPVFNLSAITNAVITGSSTDGLVGLTVIEMKDNDVLSVDIRHATNLTKFELWSELISSLDVTLNTKLTDLWLQKNANLTSIDISNNTLLTFVPMDQCSLTTLDVSTNINLTDLWLDYNNLPSSELDQIVRDLDSHGKTNGVLRISDNTGSLTASVITEYNSLVSKGWTIDVPVPVDDSANRPTLYNFKVEAGQPGRVYFSSSEIITATTVLGFTITNKTINGIYITNQGTTGHYFTVSTNFDFYSNNHIRYDGGSDMADASSNGVYDFSSQYITNNIEEPTAATTRYAAPTTQGTGDGLSEANAWSYVNAGVNAVAGMTIWMKAGTSTGTIVVGASGTLADPIKFIGYKTTIGDAVERTRSVGMAMSSVEMPLINGGAKFDTAAKNYIIVKNIQVQPNSTTVDPFDVDNSDYLVFENCYAADGKNGWFTFRTRPVTNIRLKRVYSGDMADTGMILVNKNHLVDDAYVCSSKAVGMDYYIVLYGGVAGGNSIIRNCTVDRYESDTHTNPHGITIKGDEYEDGFISEYSLIDNCTVNNVAEGVAFRHASVRYNVARNITATKSGASAYSNLVTFRGNCSYNTIENSYADTVERGVVFNMNYNEQAVGAKAGGHHNKVINTIFKGCTDVIYNNSGIGGTILPSTYNEWLNCTFYNSVDLMHYSVVDLDATNLVTNCIVDTITNKGSQNLMTFDHNNFNAGFAATGTNTTTHVPNFVDLVDFVPQEVLLKSGTPISGVEYDKDEVERDATNPTRGAIEI